jgi:hypothetical protein
VRRCAPRVGGLSRLKVRIIPQVGASDLSPTTASAVSASSGVPVALGRVDASRSGSPVLEEARDLKPWSALRARIGLSGEGAKPVDRATSVGGRISRFSSFLSLILSCLLDPLLRRINHRSADS